ncbi:MAG: hypothetical protein ABSD38_19425 [Syntrophorhabdales bacterium]|jgi:hypothetical protein
MKSALCWFVLGVHVVTGVVMLFFGVLFLRRICVPSLMSDGLIAFPSLLFVVTLHMVGGGLLFSSPSRFIKRAVVKKYGLG